MRYAIEVLAVVVCPLPEGASEPGQPHPSDTDFLSKREEAGNAL